MQGRARNQSRRDRKTVLLPSGLTTQLRKVRANTCNRAQHYNQVRSAHAPPHPHQGYSATPPVQMDGPPGGNTHRRRQHVKEGGEGWRTGPWRLSGDGEGEEAGVWSWVKSEAGVPGRTARLSGS